MSGYVQTNQPIVIKAPGVAGSYNLSAADTGKLILIPALGVAHDLVINLPGLVAGLNYRFMATATTASQVVLTPTNGLPPYTPILGLIQGVFINNNAQVAVTIIPQVNQDTVIFDITAVVGTYIDAYCDGTFWYVSGLSRIAAGIL